MKNTIGRGLEIFTPEWLLGGKLQVCSKDSMMVEEDSKIIKRNLGFKFGNRLKFTIEFVDTIALSKRGKVVYVDQQIPPDSLNCTKFPEK